MRPVPPSRFIMHRMPGCTAEAFASGGGLETGSLKRAAGSLQWAAGIWKPAAGGGRLEAGGRKLAAGGWRPTILGPTKGTSPTIDERSPRRLQHRGLWSLNIHPLRHRNMNTS